MTPNTTTIPPLLDAAGLPLPILTPLPPFLPPIPDSALLLALPIVTYWVLSLFFHFLDTNDLLSQYRLHTPEELLKRNHVTRREVVRDVVIQQVIQTVIGGAFAMWEDVEMMGNEGAEIASLFGKVEFVHRWLLRGIMLLGIDGAGVEKQFVNMFYTTGIARILAAGVHLIGVPTEGDWKYTLTEIAYWYALPFIRFGIAIFFLDTWQYFLHRAMHEVKWLYRTFHSRHHRLYVPYAFGALYNHPFEGLLMDTIGASLGFKLSGLGIRGGMTFFTVSSMKTVDDHCGYSLPWDPLQKLFWNNAGYHDIHHQSWGIKTNFSQPFLICWDRWLGTMWEGDNTAKYAASRDRAARAVERDVVQNTPKDKQVPNPPSPTDSEVERDLVLRKVGNGIVNGNGVGKVNGNGVARRSRSRTPGMESEEGLRRSMRLRNVREG